jgi:hypothetical protein
MMDGWIALSIVEFVLLLITWCGIPGIYYLYAKKKEKEMELLDQEGITVTARVKRVIKSEHAILGRRKYIVQAALFDYDSETLQRFKETFWFRETYSRPSPIIGREVDITYCNYPKKLSRIEIPGCDNQRFRLLN